MKNSKTIFLLYIIFISPFLASSQDSLNYDIVKSISYSFEIQDGKMTGVGADFLQEEFASAQFTMIGEYHDSYRISALTRAMIPMLNKANYKTMILEVGQESANILEDLSKDHNMCEANLKALNHKYTYEDDYTAIPFFSYVEDAKFLRESSRYDWDLIGIDQEFSYGYNLLLDRMYEKLDKNQKAQYKEEYEMVHDSVDYYVTKEEEGDFRTSIAIESSVMTQQFLDKMAEIGGVKEIVESFRKSTSIYRLYEERKWYANNQTRIHYMKEMLRKGMARKEFDVTKDKALIKMGAHHLSKGVSPLAFLEVGNTLNELAEFHGNSALNITFVTRYYEEDGKVIDILESEPKYNKKNFASIGDKETWHVIDLRELKPGVEYYPWKYILDSKEKELMHRYDLLIVLPTEKDPVMNN